MRAGARSAYKARPLAFREKVVATTLAPVAGPTETTVAAATMTTVEEVTMAETATSTAITTAERIPAMTAGLAREEEIAEDETANVVMGMPERREETEEEWFEVVKKHRAKAAGKRGVALKAALLLENSRVRKRPVRKATPTAKALAARATNAARPARRL